MEKPWFYIPDAVAGGQVMLDEASARHAVQVLRLQPGNSLMLTNGKGTVHDAVIHTVHKKQCIVHITHTAQIPSRVRRRVGIGISPTKNTSRLEWFLEKATELGVSDIYPLLCHRTVRAHFRHDRMQAICVSAMLQSQQAWLPALHEPMPVQDLIANMQSEQAGHYHHRWIAHCSELEKHHLSQVVQPGMHDSLLLIGPEGDFTNEEIVLAENAGFNPVALGSTRLRTETAGLAGASLLCLMP